MRAACGVTSFWDAICHAPNVFRLPATQPIFKTPYCPNGQPENLSICDRALDCRLGQDRYPLPSWLADWHCAERGTTRCSSPARVPSREGWHVDKRSFPHICFTTISGALVTEEPIAGRMRLA